MLDIGVIGAGVAGLSAAYDLARRGHRVTVYEARPYVGGLSAGFRDERWEWSLERFYHQGGIYPLDSPLRVLAFRPLPFPDRVRFGLVTAFLRYTPFWRPLERQAAHTWLSRALGKRAYEVLWEPLLIGKFGDEFYRQVNLAWFWARLAKRTPRLGYFVGGFQALWDEVAQRVQALGGTMRLESHVRQIRRDGERLRLTLAAGDVLHDRVLATCSPGMLRERTPELPAAYAAGLESLHSLGAVVLVLALNQRLTATHYWINLPKREDFPFLALVEHTNYISPEHYGGDRLVYCGDYLPAEHPYFSAEPEALLERFAPALQRVNPAFSPTWVRRMWKFSEIYAQPVPLLNHSRHIPPMETPVPGLYMANMSQVYPWDRGTNYAVQMGREAARLVGSE
jgi:protoporphyrinogen oxidase